MIDFKELLNSEQYNFLQRNERLGKRIMLLGLGGSYAYGTHNENSDIKLDSYGSIVSDRGFKLEDEQVVLSYII